MQRFPRFGAPPFRDSIEEAALRYDPKAPYGEPELGDNEGQRLFEQPDVEPSMNKNSLVAVTEPPMDLRQAALPPPYGAVSSDSEQFGQVRPGSRFGGWKVESPSPSKQGVLPPEMAPSALLPQPPVIDTRELPTEAPPENPVRRYQRELDELKAPERGPVSKWAKLAAVALGAGQGYYNAANPNARPIDASEAVQNLTLGRKYIDAMGEYQRKRKDIGERIKLAGEAEDIESRIADRTETQASRKAANDERAKNNQRTDADRNFAFSLGLARDGGTVVQSDAPPTPGARRITNPMDPTGRTSVDIVPKKENRRIGNQEIANLLRMNVDDLISDTMYQDAVGKLVDLQKARIAAEAKPDSTLTTDYKNYLLSQKDGFKGTFEQWMDRDANRRKTQLSIGGDDSKRLTPGESAALGVPYGTTRAQAEGKLASTEGQKKEAIYASRMTRANKVIKDIEGDISGQGTIGQAIQGAVPNWMKSENTQVFEQAKRDFMNAVLRQESGAVISPSEFANANTQYFPQPGDGANVLEQKRINRALALDGLVKASGNAYERPQENKPAQNAGQGRGGGGISVTAPDGSSHKFNTQAEADAFKKLAGIR